MQNAQKKSEEKNARDFFRNYMEVWFVRDFHAFHIECDSDVQIVFFLHILFALVKFFWEFHNSKWYEFSSCIHVDI